MVVLPPSAFAAGSSQASAELIGEGTFQGSAVEDQGVWFRVPVPDGKVLHVSYTLVSGHSWNELEIYDSEGTRATYADSGEVALYDPDEADAWIRVETFWGPAQYAFTVSFINPPAQNDAGQGVDAGRRPAGALTVGVGRIAGTLLTGGGDQTDWYRVDSPPGTIVDLFGAESQFVEAFNADLQSLGTIAYYDSSFTPRAIAFLAWGPTYFRVTNSWGSAYAFRVGVSLPADLGVGEVVVRNVQLSTDAGPVGASVQREVLFDISNTGSGPSRNARVLVTATHEGPTGTRVIADQPFVVGSGASTSFVIPWDTLGQVGDFVIRVLVTSDFEIATADNDARTATFIVVSGAPPGGIDLLNHEVIAAGNSAHVVYGAKQKGIVSPVGFFGTSGGAVVVRG